MLSDNFSFSLPCSYDEQGSTVRSGGPVFAIIDHHPVRTG